MPKIKEKSVVRTARGMTLKGEDLALLSWGINYPGNYPQKPRTNSFYEYHVVVSGGGRLLLGDGRSLPVRRGDAFIFDKALLSGWEGRPGQPLAMLNWAWRRPPAIPALRPLERQAWQGYMDETALRRLRWIHLGCRNTLRMPSPWMSWELQRLRLELELVLVKTSSRPPRLPEAGLAKAALAWMSEHLGEANPQVGLCRHLGISPATLNRLFRVRRQTTFRRELQRMKWKRACACLREKRLSIKMIALELGYRHPNDFSRAFKIMTGVAPSTWTKRRPAKSVG